MFEVLYTSEPFINEDSEVWNILISDSNAFDIFTVHGRTKEEVCERASYILMSVASYIPSFNPKSIVKQAIENAIKSAKENLT